MSKFRKARAQELSQGGKVRNSPTPSCHRCACLSTGLEALGLFAHSLTLEFPVWRLRKDPLSPLWVLPPHLQRCPGASQGCVHSSLPCPAKEAKASTWTSKDLLKKPGAQTRPHPPPR
jgi:hypothetical protein